MKANNKLGIVFFPAYDWAISPTHPEREERLLYTHDQLMEEGFQDIEGIEFYKHEMASKIDIQRTHIVVPSVEEVVTESHLVSIGATIKAFELVQSGVVDKSFALVRPPGHHAFRTVYGDRGFCIANIEAVALEHIRRQKKDEGRKLRVAIVDTDAHHGDGTQDIYWNDPDTLFISFHQDGRTLFPGTGFIDEAGGPCAYGLNVNIPLPPYTGEEGFLYIMEEVVLPILDDFKPDIIINSAGQDNHYSDPLTNMNFTAQGYARLNEMLDPDIAVLEGGYSIDSALPYVNMGIILAMAGMDYSNIYEPDYQERRSDLIQSPELTAYIKKMCQVIMDNWNRREEIAHEKFSGVDVVEKDQRIFYDTDGIMAYEKQSYYVPPKNSQVGLETIESKTDTGYNVFAVVIPREASQSVIDQGYTMYNELVSGGKYTHIYLQDKAQDVYLEK